MNARRSLILRFFILLMLLALPFAARADTLNVPSEYGTIQDAVDAAKNGDTVLVADGTYTGEPYNAGVVITLYADSAKSITIRSVGGSAKCMIVGQFKLDSTYSSQPCSIIVDGFTFIDGSGIVSVGSNLTVFNCNFVNGYTGLIVFNDTSNHPGATTTVSKCNFTGCTSSGMEVQSSGGSTNISSCNFTNNDTSDSGGGGLLLDDSSLPNASCTVTSCTFDSNQHYGTGLSINMDNCIVTGCTFSNNYDGLDCSSSRSSYLYKPTIKDCMFVDNSGAGLASSCAPSVTNCIFNNNSPGVYGEGSFTNCTFNNNQSAYWLSYGSSGGGGGAMYIGSATVTNCSFNDNKAVTNAGGGGAIYCVGAPSTITNCTFNGNSANGDYAQGGAIFSYADSTITNCSFSGNTALGMFGGGGAIGANEVNAEGIHALTNCILYGDQSSDGSEFSAFSVPGGYHAGPTYCDIQYTIYDPKTKTNVPSVYPGVGNINADPLFVNTDAGDFHLMQGSPCIGVGTTVGAPITDKDGQLRSAPPSIGAYEPYSQAMISSFTLSPGQIFAPGATVTANVATTGKFASMIVTCAPGSLNNVRSPPFYLTTSDGIHWTGTFSTTFLKNAKTNPIAFVATGTPILGSTMTANAYLANSTSLPALLVSLSPDHSNVGHGDIVSFTGGVADTTVEPASLTNLQITLPANVQYVPGSGHNLSYNILTNKLYASLPLNPASSFNFSFQVKVNSDVPTDTGLPFLALATCPDFQSMTASSLVTVDGGIPTDVIITDDQSGLLSGKRTITSIVGTIPLTATLSPVPQIPNIFSSGVSRPSLWFSVTRIESSDSVTYTTDNNAAGLLAQSGLISPNTNPAYMATFLNKGDYLKAHAGWSQKSIALSLMQALSIASAGKVPTPDNLLNKLANFLNTPGVNEAINDIQSATNILPVQKYSSKVLLQSKASSSTLWGVATARAFQLLTGDNGDGEKTLAAFLTALENRTIGPKEAKAIAKNAWSLGYIVNMVYEYSYITAHTNSATGDIAVSFTAK